MVIENKIRVVYPRSRYGFGDVEIGGSVVVEGEYRIVRISADGFRKRWGMCFLVKDLGEGKVKIERYK